MEPGYQRLADKPFESHYLWAEIEIDAPVATVWGLAVRIGDWMVDHRLETLDGSPGEAGFFERVHVAGLDPDVPEPRYQLYGISHLVPNRYIALEVFPERGGSFGETREWVSIDQILLNDLGPDRTRVAFAMVDTHRGHGDPAEYAQREAQLREMGVDRIRSYLERLRSQAESAARS